MVLNFHTALSGVRAAEYLISTASNNITNAQNPSYARQRVDLSTADYMSREGSLLSQMGQGVEINKIKRIVDNTIIEQTRSELGKYSRNESLKGILETIEISFNEVGESSITKLTQDLFNSFEEVSKHPEQNSYRMNVLRSAETLAGKIKEVSHSLSRISAEIDSRIRVKLGEVNELIRDIAAINQKIGESSSDNPNALLDNRDKLLDELSEYVDVNINQGSQLNDLEVSIGNTTVISGKDYNLVDSKFDIKSDEWVLGVNNIELTLNEGSIAGLIQAKNDILPDYRKSLETYTETLTNEVNNIHREGYGLDGTTGKDLFSSTNSSSIEVNIELINNPEKLGLSKEEGVAGNIEIAQELSNLQDNKVIDDQNLQDYYQEFSVGIASDLKNIKHQTDVHRNIHNELEAHRQSVQGVNIDEELIAINNYQQYYQANLKTMQTVNQVMDSLLSII